MEQASPRVFMGLVEVSGYWARLERGFERLGVEAQFVDLEPSSYAYRTKDDLHDLPRVVGWLRRTRRFSRRKGSRSLVSRVVAQLVELPLRVVLLAWAIRRYDVFIFGFRATFLVLLDLPILKLFGKRVICVFHGSDERPPYVDGWQAPGLSPSALVQRTRAQKAMARQVGRWADVVVSEPNSAQFWERPVIVYQIIGNPVDLADGDQELAALSASAAPPHDRPIRVLHAPSHPVAKGTEVVRETIAKLQTEIDLEYIEVQGVTNRELHQQIAAADLVVDQVYGDTPFAMLAAESALLNTPAIVSGYGWDHLARFLPDDFVWTKTCEPDQLAATIRELADDPDQRRRLAADGCAFITREWSPEAVAGRFCELIDGPGRPEWLFDPHDVDYPLGSGVSEQTAADNIRAVVETGGVSALQLDDKPRLLQAALRLGWPEDDGG